MRISDWSSDVCLPIYSPLARAADIRVPVFLAHGKEDERTPFRQARAMEKALEKTGNAPVWMAVKGEAHGFYAPENEIAFYRRLEEIGRASCRERVCQYV